MTTIYDLVTAHLTITTRRFTQWHTAPERSRRHAMYPTHPETLCTLSAFDYQHRLQEAANDRIAAGAQQSCGSLLVRSRGTLQAAAFWMGRALRRQIDGRRLLPSTSLSGDQARPAGHEL